MYCILCYYIIDVYVGGIVPIKYAIQHYDTSKVKIVTIEEALKIVNEDRSEEWQKYDSSDWIEGLNVFTDYTYIGEVEC